jgi:hypothetical protein
LLDRFDRMLCAAWRGLPAPLWALVIALALQLAAGPVFAKAHPHSKARVAASKSAHKSANKSMLRGAAKGSHRVAANKAQRSAKGTKTVGRKALVGSRALSRAFSGARGASSRQVGRQGSLQAGRQSARGAGRYVKGRAGGRWLAASGRQRGHRAATPFCR